MVNNYYKPGPATKENRRNRIVNPSEPYGLFYVSGNILDGNDVITNKNKKGVVASSIDSIIVSIPFEVEQISQESALESYERVLKGAGASLRRDEIDKRIIEEVRTGTASKGKNKNGIIDSQADVGGWPQLKSSMTKKDTDQDGIPDEWERANKLNPDDPGDARHFGLSKGYTNVELYINSLVAN
jgi:hypothetical protein